MLDSPVEGVEYWSINTDAQALARSKAMGAKTLNIGTAVTRGLGAGGSPEVGRLAAEESISDIQGMIAGADLCFITAGMGGGTGSGAAPVVAEISKDSGALTIAIVTKPFAFEGRRRMQQANDAIEKLRQHVDTVLVVSNNKLLEIIPDDTPVTAAFRVADEILRQGVAGISEIIVRPGLINVDFADVRAIMKDSGKFYMSYCGRSLGKGINATSDRFYSLYQARRSWAWERALERLVPKTQPPRRSAVPCWTNPFVRQRVSCSTSSVQPTCLCKRSIVRPASFTTTSMRMPM
jgi:cell division protein FtsZ